MLVLLQNLTNELLTFDLSRDIAPKRHEFPRAVTDRNGVTRKEMRRIVLADSVTLLAKESRGGFHPAVERCPQVVALVKAQRLRVVATPEVLVVEEAAPAVEDAAPAVEHFDAPDEGEMKPEDAGTTKSKKLGRNG